MRIFGFIFGNEAISAEIQSPVVMDQQCTTCKSYLGHSEERITLEGQTFCKNSCVPPSMIQAVEARAKSERLQKERKKLDDQAQAEQARYARLQESENWIKENLALLELHGLKPAPRLRELDQILHPFRKKYLIGESTMHTVRVGVETVALVQPTD